MTTTKTDRSPLVPVWVAIAGIAVAVFASFVLMMIVFVFGTPARHRLDQQQHDNTCLTLQSRPSDHSSLANRLRRETKGCPKMPATPTPSRHRSGHGKTKRQATARTPIATAPARGPQTPSTVTAGQHRPTTRPSPVRPPTAATTPTGPVRTPSPSRPSPPRSVPPLPGLLGGVAATICGLTRVPAACPTP